MTATATSKKPRAKMASPTTTASASKSKTAVDALAEPVSAGIVEISLDLIDPHPDNPRKDLGDLTELTASIAAQGLLQNVTVVPSPEAGDRFWALLGHRRIAAAREAGLTTVPAGVRTDLTPAQQIELMLIENLQRTDLTPFEEGRSYQGLLDLGVTQVEIVKATGRSAGTVSTRVKIGALDDRAVAAYTEHQLTLEQAMVLADLREEAAEVYDALWERATSYGRFMGWMLDEAKRDFQLAAKKAAKEEEFKAKGYQVLTERPGADSPARDLWSIIGVDEKSHKDCPGRAVKVVIGNQVSAHHYCMDAATHHPKPAAGEAAVDPRIAQLDAELPEVDARRKEWLIGVYTIDSPERVECRKKITAQLRAALEFGQVLVEVSLPEMEDASGATRLVVPESDIDLISLAHAWSTVDAMDFPSYGRSWANYVARWSDDVVREIKMLQAWGYELHTLEQEFLDEVAAATAEATEATESAEADETEAGEVAEGDDE